jgi:hypothetical protein
MPEEAYVPDRLTGREISLTGSTTADVVHAERAGARLNRETRSLVDSEVHDRPWLGAGTRNLGRDRQSTSRSQRTLTTTRPIARRLRISFRAVARCSSAKTRWTTGDSVPAA